MSNKTETENPRIGAIALAALREGVDDYPGGAYLLKTAPDGAGGTFTYWVSKFYVDSYEMNSFIERESTELRDTRAWMRQRQVKVREYKHKRLCIHCAMKCSYLWHDPRSEEEFCMKCVSKYLPEDTPMREGVRGIKRKAEVLDREAPAITCKKRRLNKAPGTASETPKETGSEH